MYVHTYLKATKEKKRERREMINGRSSLFSVATISLGQRLQRPWLVGQEGVPGCDAQRLQAQKYLLCKKLSHAREAVTTLNHKHSQLGRVAEASQARNGGNDGHKPRRHKDQGNVRVRQILRRKQADFCQLVQHTRTNVRGKYAHNLHTFLAALSLSCSSCHGRSVSRARLSDWRAPTNKCCCLQYRTVIACTFCAPTVGL